jgi:hypothetical protein
MRRTKAIEWMCSVDGCVFLGLLAEERPGLFVMPDGTSASAWLMLCGPHMKELQVAREAIR